MRFTIDFTDTDSDLSAMIPLLDALAPIVSKIPQKAWLSFDGDDDESMQDTVRKAIDETLRVIKETPLAPPVDTEPAHAPPGEDDPPTAWTTPLADIRYCTRTEYFYTVEDGTHYVLGKRGDGGHLNDLRERGDITSETTHATTLFHVTQPANPVPDNTSVPYEALPHVMSDDPVIEHLKAQNSNLGQQVAELSEKLTEAETARDAAVQKSNSQADGLLAAQNKLDALEASHHTLETTLSKTEAELESKKADNANLDAQLAEASAEEKRLNLHLTEVTGNMAQKNRELEASNTELTAKLKRKDNDFLKLDMELEDTKQTLQRANTTIGERDATIMKKQHRISELDNEVRRLKRNAEIHSIGEAAAAAERKQAQAERE